MGWAAMHTLCAYCGTSMQHAVLSSGTTLLDSALPLLQGCLLEGSSSASLAARDLQLGDDTMVKSSGIISINASGIIQMTNKVLTQMFG